MQQKPLEVADVFNACGTSFENSLSWDKRKVFSAIKCCRTSALGAHVRECTNCKYREQSYNSCRNRHCPRCDGTTAARWTEARSEELLPVPYFHTVFTLASELRGVAYQNKRVVYELLFRAVSESLEHAAANPQFLGAKITAVTVLHTWNQKLQYHPHIHAISPHGGISFDNSHWVAGKKNFFLPVRALSKLFRGKMISFLRQAHREGKLSFYGELKSLEQSKEFEKLLSSCRKSNWVVYSKKPFGGPQQIVKYLSAYVHRVAISNRRLRKLVHTQVTFSYRDSKRKNKKRKLTLSAQSFTQRFLLHILPKNFTRIRHYGFLSTATKRLYLPLAKHLLSQFDAHSAFKTTSCTVKEFTTACPKCSSGTMRYIIPHSAMLPAISLTAPATPTDIRLATHPPPAALFPA